MSRVKEVRRLIVPIYVYRAEISISWAVSSLDWRNTKFSKMPGARHPSLALPLLDRRRGRLVGSEAAH